jgi:cyclophilin family peptidyl-prolyl cis-trans isomerase
MIQGGQIKGITSVYGTGFEDELSNEVNFARPGILAMANQGKGTNTNGSQFFITMAHTEWLDGHHTIFGEVFGGYKTVWKICRGPRDKSNKPLEDQKILKAYMEVL